MSKHLDEPILDRGILNTNFFNGRLLTAEDLKVDQKANRQQHQQLGQAIGEGVITGLEVRLLSPGSVSSLPLVMVSKGMALNRSGNVLSLPDDEQVTLTRKLELPPPEAGLFTDCAAATSTVTSLADGIYMLVIGPASGFSGRAPLQALGEADAIAGCGSRYAAEGVRFRLARFDVSSMTALGSATREQINNLASQTDSPSLSRLRNLLAHVCFGSKELAAVARDPFKQAGGKPLFATYGAIDFMRGRGEITDCEVPLALVHWRAGLVRFLDMWSARRRVYSGIAHPLSHLIPTRRRAEAEAIFFQFQQQVEEIFGSSLSQGQLAAIAAESYFLYLPAAGLIPVGGVKASRGFDYQKFFEHRTYRKPVFMDGARLESLIDLSLIHPPIDLGNKELIWLYLVRQNMQSITEGTFGLLQPYLFFSSGHIAFQGEARYDLAYFNYSNYS